jgi:hypothetical protein
VSAARQLPERHPRLDSNSVYAARRSGRGVPGPDPLDRALPVLRRDRLTSHPAIGAGGPRLGGRSGRVDRSGPRTRRSPESESRLQPPVATPLADRPVKAGGASPGRPQPARRLPPLIANTGARWAPRPVARRFRAALERAGIPRACHLSARTGAASDGQRAAPLIDSRMDREGAGIEPCPATVLVQPRARHRGRPAAAGGPAGER